ncbi:unnamed protein product, partial [marine sediment metagenome]
ISILNEEKISSSSFLSKISPSNSLKSGFF